MANLEHADECNASVDKRRIGIHLVNELGRTLGRPSLFYYLNSYRSL